MPTTIGYNALPRDRHFTVNHSEGEYSDGNGVYINTAEAEFSVLRPWIATYRGVSKEKLYLCTKPLRIPPEQQEYEPGRQDEQDDRNSTPPQNKQGNTNAA